MRAFVFTDESLAGRAGQFVWLDINTDDPRNEAFVSRFPVDSWPTFRVIDSRTEEVLLERAGSLTVAQMHAFLDEAQACFAGRTGTTPADLALAAADRLAGGRRYAEAGTAYREAIEAAPADWPPWSRAVEAELFAYQAARAPGLCAQRAAELLAQTKQTFRLVVAGTGLQCALDMPDAAPGRAEWIAVLEPEVALPLEKPVAGVAADDVSGLFLTLAMARRQAGDETGRRRVLGEWKAFLEASAGAANTAEERTVFDSHRVTVALELGEPETAVAMLARSARDLPTDYNPPARLAVVYQALGRWDEAIAASDRALALVQGPRRLRILQGKATAQEKKGDIAGAIATLEEALVFATSLDVGESRTEPVRKKLEELRSAALGRATGP